jgi:hypothetical protein
MAFHVGQLVVCVDDSFSDAVKKGLVIADLNGLQKGVVYTIRGLTTSIRIGRPAVYLEEIMRPFHWLTGKEYPYEAHRFRPVTKRNQEIVASLLAPVKDEVSA